MKKLSLWLKDVHGATAIEYGLIAAGIALALSAVVFAIGGDLLGTFQTLSTALTG